MKKRCKDCKNFFMDGEGWELSQFDYPNCHKKPHYSNLWSFPFTNTKCPEYDPVPRVSTSLKLMQTEL